MSYKFLSVMSGKSRKAKKHRKPGYAKRGVLAALVMDSVLLTVSVVLWISACVILWRALSQLNISN